MPTLTFTPLWDRFLSEGAVTLTARDIADRAGASMKSAYEGIRRAMDEGRLFSPAKGLYVLVPPEYRAWGAVPADWYIDDLMKHLKRRYYISYLTAAALHGASHQASQIFQVVTDREVRPTSRHTANVRLRFYTNAHAAERAVESRTGPTGRIVVATPETCLLDLAENPEAGGGVSTLVEVVADLKVDSSKLAAEAEKRTRSAARRCGWILSRTHPGLDLTALRTLAAPGEGDDTLLVASGQRRGEHDPTWGIVVNTWAEGGS